MDSKRDIFDRIRNALGVAPSETREADRINDWNSLPRTYRQQSRLTEAELLALFDERIRHYNGTPFYSQSDIKTDIAEILDERNKRVLMIPYSFPSEWLPDGFMFIPDEGLSYDQLDSTDGVLTCCTLGIALTGTVVLRSSLDQGRRAATLIPDYHLCVLQRQDIVELVPEAIRRLEPLKGQPLTFFSGPSATVDIEMTRVRGVHGPRTLDVLIV
ncbi:MAG: LUD domain-containing protein [Acidobacteriaceae bacterium]|nr:LUD domain-containing protein [Acidobacteriaceae bacterium]